MCPSSLELNSDEFCFFGTLIRRSISQDIIWSLSQAKSSSSLQPTTQGRFSFREIQTQRQRQVKRQLQCNYTQRNTKNKASLPLRSCLYPLRRLSCSKQPVEKTNTRRRWQSWTRVDTFHWIALSTSSFSKNDKGDKSFVFLSRYNFKCQKSDIVWKKFFTKCSSSWKSLNFWRG